MHIKTAIELIHARPRSWVRVQEVRKSRGHLDLCLSIHKENSGRKKIDEWSVTCRGIREMNLSDFDGGGLALYSATHPAARQYLARHGTLRWRGKIDKFAVLGALYQAHTAAVNDWIPFDRYVSLRSISDEGGASKGPDFLMRAYAKTLRAQGADTQFTLLRKRKATSLEVLHFGASSVVAASFTAEHRDDWA